MVAALALAAGAFALVRTGGVTSGVIGSDFHWRWTPTAEERLLAQAAVEPPLPAPAEAPAALAPSQAPAASPVTTPGVEPAPRKPAATPSPLQARPAAPAAVETKADWPGFRGPRRDSVIRGVRIDTDWSKSPPVALWRRPIGPGWSSFAVHGDFLYTQEQRGDEEMVACYKVSTGEPVWNHRDAVRFYESNGGAGPRGTPTLSQDRVYAFGATGILNALDAATGAVVWSHDATSDTESIPRMGGGRSKIPEWGYSSSPLVVGDVVIVAVAGKLVGYDLATGKPRWSGTAGGVSYSSPQLMTIDGVA
jgi:hypothetical protein